MKLFATLAALMMAFNVHANETAKTDASKMDPAMNAKMAEMMKTMKEYGTPGEQHKMLMQYAGNFNYTMKSWMSPNTPPEESKGKSTFKSTFGGKQLQQNITGKAMGMPFEGLGFVGYNNFTKQFETTFIDGMGTGQMHGTGTWDAATKTITENGEYPCPYTKNMHEKYRGEWVFPDADHITYTMYGPGMNGEKMMKNMEIQYTRVGKQSLAQK